MISIKIIGKKWSKHYWEKETKINKKTCLIERLYKIRFFNQNLRAV